MLKDEKNDVFFVKKMCMRYRKGGIWTQMPPFLLVGIPGLEPGITGPESVVLPITPYPNYIAATLLRNPLISELRCKGSAFRETDKGFRVFFSSKGDFSEFGTRKREEISTFVVRKD